MKIDTTKPFEGIITVTPEMAEEWLTRNNNRRRRVQHIKFLAEMITSGEWRPDHPHPIIIGSDGFVVDGQHRLHAIILSGKAVSMRVQFGVDPTIRKYIDNNIPRSLGDRVTFMDDPSLNKKAAEIVNALFTVKYNQSNKKKPTPDEALFLWKQYEPQMIALIEKRRNERGTGRAYVYAALIEYCALSMERGVEFFNSLMNPDGPVQPARMLRDWLLRSANTIDCRGGRGMNVVYKKSVYCMKAHLADKSITAVREAQWGVA